MGTGAASGTGTEGFFNAFSFSAPPGDISPSGSFDGAGRGRAFGRFCAAVPPPPDDPAASPPNAVATSPDSRSAHCRLVLDTRSSTSLMLLKNSASSASLCSATAAASAKGSDPPLFAEASISISPPPFPASSPSSMASGTMVEYLENEDPDAMTSRARGTRAGM